MSFSSDLSNTKLHATLQYQKVGNDQLNLKGKHKEAEVELSLRLREPSSFPALSHKLKLITGEIKRIE